MNKIHGKGIEPSQKKGNTFSRFLRYYESSDFELQQRARFMFIFCLCAIACSLLILLATAYVQMMSPNEGKFYLPVILTELSVVILFCASFVLLLKGYHSASSHLLLISSLTGIWLVIWMDKGEVVSRLDTVIMIVAILSMVPLLVKKYKGLIFLYGFINIVILFTFTLISQQRLKLPNATAVDFFVDALIAIVFISTVGYAIHTINKRLLARMRSDMQECLAAENALERSENKYKELTDLLPQMVFETDLEGRFTYVNKAGFDVFGFSDEDMRKGVKILSLISSDEIGLAAANIKRVMKGEFNSGHQYMMLKKDGTVFPVQIYSSVILEDQKPVGLRGIAIDITEQKQAETALKESEALFKNLVELAPYGIALNDVQERYIMINRAFSAGTGYSVEEAIGKTPQELGSDFNPEDSERIREELKSRGYVENIETAITSKYGQRIDIYYSCRIIHLNGQPVILSATINITEKKIVDKELEIYRNHLELLVKERTEELETANEELTAINEDLYTQRKELEEALINLQNTQKQLFRAEKMASLGVLAAGVAHEINNPLNFISGGVYGIKNYFKDNLSDHVENVLPLLDAVNTGVSRAAEIVKSLNRFSRQTESTTEKCDIHSIINNCLVILYNETKNRIEIHKQFTDEAFTLIGNEGKLHQAMLNILSNAVQAIPDLGTITISSRIQERLLFIKIQDTGQGIKESDLNKIFDPFFTTKEPGKGTGLGLSISYQIIKEFNGAIEVHSEEGKGTDVTMSFPIDKI